MEENMLTRTLEFLPFLSGLTALSSPAGMGIYWTTNSCLSLAQSVGTKQLLKGQGLDIRQMQRDNRQAAKDPLANA